MNNNMTTAAVHGSFDIIGQLITKGQTTRSEKEQEVFAAAMLAAGLHILQATFDRLDQISASLRQLAENDQIRLERERSI